MIAQGNEADRGERLCGTGTQTRKDLVTSNKEAHRHKRKLLAPFFQPRYISIYADTIVHYAEEATQKWQDGEVIDLYPTFKNDVTTKILGQAFLGTDKVDSDGTLSAIMHAAFESVVKKVFTAFTFKLPGNLEAPSVRRAKAARKASDDYKETIGKDLSSEEELSEVDLKAHIDLFHHLAQVHEEDGNKITRSDAMNECWGLMLGGFHTTPTALTWAWYLLCQHPAVYQKLQQEVDSTLQGRAPTHADLARLPYCSQVFKEVIRLYPPAPMIRRETQDGIELDGCPVPKGATITMSPYLMHRKPEFYPDPERFDPDRFLPEREKLLPRYAFMPFGGGSRICIGNHFVMMEGPLLIATLAQRLTFTLIPDQPAPTFDLEHGLALVPHGKIEVRVNKR
jgi:cytochrome P450